MGISLWFGGAGFFIIYGVVFVGFFVGGKLFSSMDVLWLARSAFVWGVSIPLSFYMYLEWVGMGCLRLTCMVLVGSYFL